MENKERGVGDILLIVFGFILLLVIAICGTYLICLSIIVVAIVVVILAIIFGVCYSVLEIFRLFKRK